jgi:DNA-binding winged helix-turn-helix (wHTH) protein/TolB-like protein/Tfp pilus assembly protein PilF
MQDEVSSRYRFDGYEVDGRTRTVRDPAGAPLALTAKAFDVLWILLERRDEVVARDALIAAVWPGRVVEENNLTQAISALRRALGTGPGEHRYIVTVPGRGYRFVGELEDAGRRQPGDAGSAVASLVAAWWGGRRLLLPVLLLALVATVAVLQTRQAPAPAPTATPAAATGSSLAILPFASSGSWHGDPLLGQVLAEALAGRLGRAKGLQVGALASARAARAARLDPQSAGRLLGADLVLDGTLDAVDDQVQLAVRLVAAADGRVVWAQSFSAPASRALGLQDAIAEGVAGALDLPLPTAQAVPACGSPDAYRAYVAAQVELDRFAPVRVQRAHAHLQRALSLDPGCALAHQAMASLHLRSILFADADPRVTLPLVHAALAEATALHPDLPGVHLVRGGLALWVDRDAAAAEAAYRRALTLDPNMAEAHLNLSGMLSMRGDAEAAAPHLRLARALDPLSTTIAVRQAAYEPTTDGVRARIDQVLALEPDYWMALWQRGHHELEAGQVARAVADLEQAAAQSGRTSRVLVTLARAYVRNGQPARARALLAELQARARVGYVPPSSIAAIHAVLGERDQALAGLAAAFDHGDVLAWTAARSAVWAPMEDDPRLVALLARQAG